MVTASLLWTSEPVRSSCLVALQQWMTPLPLELPQRPILLLSCTPIINNFQNYTRGFETSHQTNTTRVPQGMRVCFLREATPNIAAISRSHGKWRPHLVSLELLDISKAS